MIVLDSYVRKQEKIQPNGSWKKFLQSHWNSLYSMDFMTVDTLFGKRLYLFIILKLKSRKIRFWAVYLFHITGAVPES